MGQNQEKWISIFSKLLGAALVISLWACAGGTGGALAPGDEKGSALGGAQGQATPTHSEGTVDPKWDGNPDSGIKKNNINGNDENGSTDNDGDDKDSEASEPGIKSPPGGRPPLLGEPGYLDNNHNNGSQPAKIKMPGKI